MSGAILQSPGHDIETEDYVAAVATFRNGATGLIESSTAVKPALKSRVEIHGTEGVGGLGQGGLGERVALGSRRGHRRAARSRRR
jgi:predicted dehydrogenase